jgi:hypothetical protein
VKGIEYYFLIVWPILSPFFSFGLGAAFTRWILIPRYCPRCQMYLAWNEDRKAEAKRAKDEKPN